MKRLQRWNKRSRSWRMFSRNTRHSSSMSGIQNFHRRALLTSPLPTFQMSGIELLA